MPPRYMRRKSRASTGQAVGAGLSAFGKAIGDYAYLQMYMNKNKGASQAEKKELEILKTQLGMLAERYKQGGTTGLTPQQQQELGVSLEGAGLGGLVTKQAIPSPIGDFGEASIATGLAGMSTVQQELERGAETKFYDEHPEADYGLTQPQKQKYTREKSYREMQERVTEESIKGKITAQNDIDKALGIEKNTYALRASMCDSMGLSASECKKLVSGGVLETKEMTDGDIINWHSKARELAIKTQAGRIIAVDQKEMRSDKLKGDEKVKALQDIRNSRIDISDVISNDPFVLAAEKAALERGIDVRRGTFSGQEGVDPEFAGKGTRELIERNAEIDRMLQGSKIPDVETGRADYSKTPAEMRSASDALQQNMLQKNPGWRQRVPGRNALEGGM